jgi:hypothetical protein
MSRYSVSFCLALIVSGTFSNLADAAPDGLNLRIGAPTTWSGRPDTYVPLPTSVGTRAEFTLDINLAGFTANGTFSDPTNTRQTFNLLPNAFINKVEWINLTFHTEGASYLNEFLLSTNNSNETAFFDHAPSTTGAGGVYGPASGTFGVPPIQSVGGPFQLLANGQLLVYVYEDFNDPGVDAVVDSGTLRVTYSDTAPVVPPPATIGTLVTSDTTSNYATPDVSATKNGGSVQWYKITLTGDVSATNGQFLDIDTEGAADGTSSFDTELALFASNGQLIATDDDSGSGPTSQLTFGDAGPRGPLTTAPATTAGFPGDGFNGDLLAGDYYLAVAGFNAAFTNGFGATTNSTNTTGIVPVNIRTNVPEPGCVMALGIAGAACLLRRRNGGR